MDIKHALENVDKAKLQAELFEFLNAFITPAFGSLPKREMELRVFDLMCNLGLIRPEATIYGLMTDLKVTRTKASQLIFDLEIRKHGGDEDRLDQLVKEALMNTRFAKDGDYFVMEIEHPLTLAHMRQKIRALGHISDTSFNSALVRAPVDTVTDLMLEFIPKDQQQSVKNALIRAGAPDGSLKGVIKGSLKRLGQKVIGQAADQVTDHIVDNAADFLKSMTDASVEQIEQQWKVLFSE